MHLRRTAAVLSATAALSLSGVAVTMPAQAAPLVTGGLVNITVANALNNNTVNVQVPIGVAANVCGVAVGIIAEQQPGPVNCTAATTQDLPVAFR